MNEGRPICGMVFLETVVNLSCQWTPNCNTNFLCCQQGPILLPILFTPYTTPLGHYML